MPTNTNAQPTLEPVHVRADQPATPAATPKPPTPPSEASKAAPAAAQQPIAKQSQPNVKKLPQQPNSGVTMAIFATVIIVLGLAALAVLAYIKTKK